jgi:hypothetical protein
MSRLLSLAMLLGLSLNASACNIPVFRYALERWQTDSYEIVVFHDGLTSEQESFVAGLEALSTENDGPANANVVRVKTDGSSTENDIYTGLLKSVSQSTAFRLPYIVVRSQAGQGRVIQPWQGTFDQSKTIGLIDSPVRKELVRRIQNGHSIVWLLIKSTDAKRSGEMTDLMKAQCDELATKIKLPEGIGLPGSELHSEIPLLVKFSYLEIDRQDPREQFLVSLFLGVHPDSTDKDEPLVVPVFGRGRALEVIPASDVNPSLMEDLTLFMSSACSCQVKERNPGFDLLISTHWNRELFGENGLIPPPAKTVADRDRAPTLLAIPPGKKK